MLTAPRVRFASLLPLAASGGLVLPGPVQGQDAAPADDALPEIVRPKFQFLRDREDWSVLRGATPAQKTDFWDPIKFVPLNADGSIWASFGGSTRLRLEGWNEFGFADDQDDTFLLWRALLHMDVHVGEHVRAFVQGKSALSTRRDLPGGRRTLDVDTIDLQQAFGDVSLGDDLRFTFRGGRQALLYGKQRLVSPLPWANTLRTWDGFKGILEVGGWRVEGWWTQFAPVQKYEFNDPDSDQPFWGAYATTKFDALAGLGLDLYLLGREREGATFNGTTGDEDRYTAGGRISGVFADGAVDYDFEGAYQWGDVGSGDVSAYMIGSDIGWTFDAEWKPRLGVEFDLGSGDDSPGGDVETFNQLFPLGHKYLGYMDYLGRQNVIALTFAGSVAPIKNMNIRLAGLLFWRHEKADAVYNAGGGVLRAPGTSDASEIGQEIDLTVSYKFNANLTALFGYSHFFAGDFLDETGAGSDSDFLYVQMEYTF